jgi:hypothetical protein
MVLDGLLMLMVTGIEHKDGFAFGYPIGINYADICPELNLR